MGRELYLCHTPYQVLVELCRAMHAAQKPDLILICSVPGAQALAERLSATGLFGSVRCFDEEKCGSALQRGVLRTLLLQRFLGRRNVEKHYGFSIDPALYDKVYIHNDWSVLGRYLQDKHIPYILCEDTFASTCRPSHPLIDQQRAAPWFRLRQAIGYGYLYWGDWKGVAAVETECARRTPLFAEKLAEHSKAALFHSLTGPQKALIRQVFLTQPLPETAEGAVLFLPRDFAAEGLLDVDTQKRMFLAVAGEYCKGGPLFVKAHPRDATDYGALFPGAVILERTMPSEVLNFALPFRFARAVTVESTVLKSLEVADEALELTLCQALALLT